MRPDVLVIGAGFAGLSAAVRLAEAGRHVLVVEERPRLGGRATAFTDRDSGERVDNGQHVLFGCYRETYDLLDLLGTASRAPLQSRLSLLMADDSGHAYRLSCPPLPPPWHLLLGLARWRALTVRDRLAVLQLRPVLARVRRVGASAVAATVSPTETVTQWLERHGQTARLRRWLWDPLAVAALNEAPDVAAAAPFVRVLGELFGPRLRDSTIGLPAVPLDELYAEPARRHIEGRGGQVRSRTRARLSLGDDGAVRAAIGDEVVVAPVVISAVPWFDLARLWDPMPARLEPLIRRAAALPSSAIVTANLWFDGPIGHEPFVGLVNGPMHWAFDKAALLGPARAGHLSVVASGADALVGLENTRIVEVALGQLRRALPAVARRQLVRAVVVREPRATFSVAPGTPERPGVDTGLPGFLLAGDWTETGLPATVEGAVASGHLAARRALARLGTRTAGGG